MHERYQREHNRNAKHNDVQHADLRKKTLGQRECDARVEKARSELAIPVGIDDHFFAEQNRAADDHDEFLCKDDHDHVKRKPAARQEAHERCEKHQLVRKRVKHFPNVGDPVVAPRQEAIQQVGQKSGNIGDKAGKILCLGKKIYKYADHQDAQRGKYVGNMPHAKPRLNSCNRY